MPRVRKYQDPCPVEIRALDFITVEGDTFTKWLEWQNRWARRHTPAKVYNNGERTPQMGGYSGFINY
jgi:hypothetical protein